jgi:DNA-binding NarL/FixJ family response regulator
MQSEANMRLSRPKSEPSRPVWVECHYPLISLGLTQTLRAAGYDYLLSGQNVPVGEGKLPSGVIYCPNGEEDVAQEVKRLQGLFTDVPILVLGPSVKDVSLARFALQAGARGFLHLEMQPSQIARALRLACQGEVVFPRNIVTHLIGEETPSELLLALTARQREILELVAQGLTNAEIARRLFLAEGTVKQHLRAAYKLLNVRSRVQAVALLRRHNPAGAIRGKDFQESNPLR